MEVEDFRVGVRVWLCEMEGIAAGVSGGIGVGESVKTVVKIETLGNGVMLEGIIDAVRCDVSVAAPEVWLDGLTKLDDVNEGVALEVSDTRDV